MGRNVKLFAVSIIVGVFLVLLLIGAVLGWTPASEAPQPNSSPISEIEKQQIQSWIEENDLNKYGDPKNTLYPGGTPLYNEGTGETIDLYDYILGKHPDRPWLK
jgi:hypothetical protein